MALKQVYLGAYNLAQLAVWVMAATAMVADFVEHENFTRFFAVANQFVGLGVFLAFMEVTNAALGLVPVSPVPTFIQCAGRAFVMAVMYGVPQIQEEIPVAVVLCAWTISEIVRYSWLLLNTLNMAPYALTWLRYSLFIPLYPTGMLGEVATMFKAARYTHRFSGLLFKRDDAFVADPDVFTFDVRMWVVVVCWPVVWFSVYKYMFKQRANKLGNGAQAQNTKRTAAAGTKKPAAAKKKD